ncbi:MAG: hypothetical protein KF749_16015 [Bacteroidetes bacterium]|nr:hypothetical protein [Bacteroidota bacterium]MCW5894178.1 hypothetical protein [Bacteroidota bacterium]
MNEFQFHTKLDQTLLLGIKARNVQGLLEGIRNVPNSSIYYHTHRFLQQHHYLSPEPPNDFAYWTSEVIGDAVLGEQLSSVDIVQFHTIEELRERFVSILESHLDSMERLTFSPPGEEFHFMASRLFVFPTDRTAANLSEFIDALGQISINSIYYHVFDAKLRLARGDNDFSRWFFDLGMEELADEMRSLDPYAHTLEGLRKRIIILAREYDNH